MKKRQIHYLLAILLILGSLILLVSTNLRSALQYYVTVSELRAGEIKYQDKILKVAGTAQQVQVMKQGLRHDFLVVEGSQAVQVHYEGFVPDTFREGSEVVVTGHLNPEGDFIATEILAKCASKYEAKLKP